VDRACQVRPGHGRHSPYACPFRHPRALAIAAALLALAATLAAVLSASPAQPAPARAHATATCADHANQAAAQRAADTRDPDGDGRYCESLPCPCLAPGPSQPPPTPAPAPSNPSPSRPTTPTCASPTGVQPISFSKTKYPNIRRHFRAALRRGWPRTLVLNRPGADARRERLLRDVPTRSGHDRDEYPPAVARGRGKGLRHGSHPRGWKADVRYVPSAENRSHGSTLGIKLRRFCDGTRFRYVFY
jgi:hypothetical protein